MTNVAGENYGAIDIVCNAFTPETSDAWAAAYVQPSRRPTDGRYGENPNRLQHYYQFQVLMKPSPPSKPASARPLPAIIPTPMPLPWAGKTWQAALPTRAMPGAAKRS